MLLMGILLLASFAGFLWGAFFLTISGKKLAKDTLKCPKCGGRTSVSGNPSNSRLVIECKGKHCDYRSFISVRASALSLFGLMQLILTFIVGALGFVLAHKLGYGPAGRILAAVVFAIAGGLIARSFVRFVAFSLLRSDLSPAWHKEIVAYLAPILPPEDGSGRE